jgi:hypothetical protein
MGSRLEPGVFEQSAGGVFGPLDVVAFQPGGWTVLLPSTLADAAEVLAGGEAAPAVVTAAAGWAAGFLAHWR